MCCSPWGGKELDKTEQLNWTEQLLWVWMGEVGSSEPGKNCSLWKSKEAHKKEFWLQKSLTLLESLLLREKARMEYPTLSLSPPFKYCWLFPLDAQGKGNWEWKFLEITLAGPSNAKRVRERVLRVIRKYLKLWLWLYYKLWVSLGISLMRYPYQWFPLIICGSSLQGLK